MPHQRRIPALPALLSALCLMACAQRQAVQVPATLLQCPAQPAVNEGMDDPALARWILDTVEAAEICRTNLGLVRGLIEK